MPVDQATYRGYDGVRAAGKRAAMAIAGTMIRKMRRGRIVKIFVFILPWMVCLLSVVVLSFWYTNKDQIPQFFRGENLLRLLNRQVQDVAAPFALLVAALVGGPLIAEDRRAKALPLYFSRPITHFDYVLGKMYALFFFLGTMMLLPPILMFLVEVSLNPKEGVFAEQLPTLFHSLVPSAARMVSLSAVVLGVSALAKRTNHAVLLFFGIIIPAQAAATIFARQVFDDPSWFAMSPKASVDRITMEFLPAAKKLDERRFLYQMPVSTAWFGLAVWTAAGLGLLVARIRKVEVVT